MLALFLLAAAAAAVPSALPPSPDDLRAAGWTPLASPRAQASPCALELPRLPRPKAIPLMTHLERFPRPSVACSGSEPVTLPLAVNPTNLVWDGPMSASTSTLGWQLTAKFGLGPRGLATVDLDLPPIATTAEPVDADEQGVLYPAPQDVNLTPLVLPRPPVPRRDGAMLPSSAKVALQQPEPSPVSPQLAARVVEDLDHDALLATPDAGRTWLELALALPVETPVVHRLDARAVFAVPGGLVVVPTPQRPRATFEAFRITLEQGVPGVSGLGSLKPAGAPWSCEATDTRVDARGNLQVALLARDSAPRNWPRELVEGRRNCWGAVMSLGPDHAWHELLRFPLPDYVHSPVVRFATGAANALELEAAGVTVATWPLPS